ncbi:DUF977 family protein [Lelliottia sp. RWM.1]|nr:DUF977 family protein [Lelliottia sp. RWM.1]
MPRPKTHNERALIITWIIELVKQYGHATTKEIAAMFGIHRTTAEKYIRVAMKRGESAWMGKKYGRLNKKTWRADIRAGFKEAFRVLRPHGVLIFKWNETQIPVSQILALTDAKPAIGQRTGKNDKTHWISFVKSGSEPEHIEHDTLMQYATKRIVELENLLLVDVQETVWPAEVGVVFSQVESVGDLPAHHQRRLKHHINRMLLERMPVPAVVTAACSLAHAMGKHE